MYDLRQDPHEKRNVAADPAYEKIKQDLVRRMWRFACREQDTAINSYITVSLAPFGPAEAFRGRGTACRAPTENSDADTPPCA